MFLRTPPPPDIPYCRRYWSWTTPTGGTRTSITRATNARRWAACRADFSSTVTSCRCATCKYAMIPRTRTVGRSSVGRRISSAYIGNSKIRTSTNSPGGPRARSSRCREDREGDKEGGEGVSWWTAVETRTGKAPRYAGVSVVGRIVSSGIFGSRGLFAFYLYLLGKTFVEGRGSSSSQE